MTKNANIRHTNIILMCITPLRVMKNVQANVNQQSSIPVPCGKCPECVSRRTSAWSFRLMQQEKKSIYSLFITLTYDTEHVPITPNGFMSLSRTTYERKRNGKMRQISSDLQQFLRKLRKSIEGNPEAKPIKYYAVGEYGGITKRPHYHLIIFNATESQIEAVWKNGKTYYGTVTGASIGYCLKYISKPKRIPEHVNDDRVPEFAIMSKGLGQNYVTDEILTYHQADLTNRMCLILEGGKKASMPRYYKNLIYTEEQKKQIGLIYKTQHEYAEHIAKRRYQGEYDRDKTEMHKAQFQKQVKNAKKDKT